MLQSSFYFIGLILLHPIILDFGYQTAKLKNMIYTDVDTNYTLISNKNYVFYVINRPGVAGAVLHTASSFINSVSKSVSLFLKYLLNPKPEELGS